MNEFNLEMSLSRVLAILLKALDHIDARLVDHGYRVAYIIYKMLQTDGSYPIKDMREICVVAALHDIGAYKTEEIDDMMRFESEAVYDHSIYGYLFLKHMSPLRKWSRVVLYHHLNFELHHQIGYEYMNIADMIHLADRIDVVLQTRSRWMSYEELSRQQDIRFSRSGIELFRKADKLFDIKGNMTSGAYVNELNDLIEGAEYGDDKLLEFIKMIAYSIDFRSETTVSHVITTVCIAMELGMLLGLDDAEIKKIQLGAYLHDIGKISIPLEVLEKPGPLTGEEIRIMRRHAEITKDILEGRIHKDVIHVAFRHHEKLDGSGYPYGLKAEQLTISDMIVAVADIMSALTGKRSYKESFPKEEVIAILQRQKDLGKLCADVTDAATRHYDAIMKVCKENVAVIRGVYERISKEFLFIKKRLEEIE